ncbi:glycosyltransferase family 2 protein [uncultured Helicobacter sp.]|uniref:glycosyltransferase family 2 protein n=1 Tax=uncultured Helicobacter sp. TaxID=175537 RepID=UPI0037517168
MSAQPQVEVIISLYNYQDYIVQCVDSVLKQSYTNIIINIIDDGSSDKSVEVLRRAFPSEFPTSARLKLITQANQGQLGAFNTGFENLDSKSEIVLFLDADDYMQPEYVAHIVEQFQSQQCDYIFCNPKILDMGIESKPISDIIESKESQHIDSGLTCARSGASGDSLSTSDTNLPQANCVEIIESQPISDIIESKPSKRVDLELANSSFDKVMPSRGLALPIGDLSFGIFRTYYLLTYFGTSTSSIAITRETLAKILPLRSIESKWRIRADDCIIYGAALVGAKMYRTSYEGIVYRVHTTNNYCGKSFSPSYEFGRTLAVQELFAQIMEKNGILLTYRVFMQEFLLAPKPKKRDYLKILSLCDFTLSQKIWAFFRIVLH